MGTEIAHPPGAHDHALLVGNGHRGSSRCEIDPLSVLEFDSFPQSSHLKAGKIAQPGQPEPVTRDLAGGIAGFARAAHVWPLAIDDAPRIDADLSHQSGTSVSMAPHAIQAVLN